MRLDIENIVPLVFIDLRIVQRRVCMIVTRIKVGPDLIHDGVGLMVEIVDGILLKVP